ncbi:hypothetical protein [Actimicrobium sp. CCI2.3]|uniref:hypothetical protein n=1 Tax=Actimicrobium sp. CCI2.3 TaxID=3048616 RepID=UPI002AB59D0A|nr:hypothetical protein [Actimicrobium sp. CCI2.3]MDY7574901.1 hypothetical protein [Actimicrobium sp. CCI2.3]MEB0023368.1 hypothetical protein [Actimicrobium sp. CCI2.3]
MKIATFEELGAAVRATRVALDIPLADLAGTLGTSSTMLRRQEQGKATAALKILFATLHELGVELILELPPGVPPVTSDPAGRKKRARP